MFLIPLNMPEREEAAEEYIEPEDITEKTTMKENGCVGNGKLDNERNSDDSAYVSNPPSASVVLRPRPRSSYLSPYRDQSLVVSPSTSSVHHSLSRSTASLAARYLGVPLTKKAKSSEFGSMTTIPIIPNTGAYRSLQQIPVPTTTVDVRHHNTDTPLLNTSATQHHQAPVDLPAIVTGDTSLAGSLQDSTEDINENYNLISNLPGKQTDLLTP